VSIKILARTWDAFGKRDPLWAVLTDRRLSLEEFFQSGEDEVQAALDHAQKLGITVNRDRALDFGCGVGRLTQAMARRFRGCDGVDIASSMIDAANRHNRHPDTCRYHLNTAGDLGLFPGRPFTFVYTTLVLQHMEPAHAKGYLREFIRLLAPGGLLVFQIPSHRGPDEPPAGAPRTVSAGPLPLTAFQADVRTPEGDLTVQAGQLMTVPVVVRNRSDSLWPSLGRPDFRYQVQVANRWLHPDGSAFGDGARCPLPYDVAPGAEARVLLGVGAPDINGVYTLELDVVQEDVAWFGDRGSSTAQVQVTVEGGRPADPALARRRPRLPRQPLRMRYPRLYRAYKATGVRGVVKACRYVTWAARREREVWRRGHGTTMEMHCIPQDEVAALVHECGATLVEAERHAMDGGFQSRRYWVVRRS
jgi:SAM-dependent methyltransferase